MICAQPTAVGSKARMACTRCPRWRRPARSSRRARPPPPAPSGRRPTTGGRGRRPGRRGTGGGPRWPVRGPGRQRSMRASSWTRIWGCASPPMAPTRWLRRPVGRGDQHGGEGVGRSSPRPDLGRVALDEREAHAPVVQEDAGRRLQEVRTEVERVRLGQARRRSPSPSMAQRWVVSPSPTRATEGPPVPPPGSHVGCGGRSRAEMRAAAASSRARVEQRPPVGSVEEERRAGRARRRARTRPSGGPSPGRRARLPRPARLGHGGPGQGQVALRRRGHRPQLVAPGALAQRGTHHSATEVSKSAGLKCPAPRRCRPAPNSPR